MTNAVPSGDLVPQGAVLRDDNDNPVQGTGITLSNSKTLVGNNTTVNVPIFTVSGSVLVLAMWGNITTALGANNTAAYWRLNDGTNQSDITLSTGTTISAATKGAIIVKKGLAAAALAFINGDQERVSEPTTLETTYFSPIELNAKNGATTNIEFTYTTTDTPTSGVINFYVQYIPLGQSSKIQTV